MLEKPFGTDQASAADLNRLLTRLVPEAQVHRVDHFLGRSTVLNLLGLRFANRLFEPVWNNLHVERVDIVFDEQLALENRARYYDSAGALMDMIQSHLLQVLALVAMEPPAAVNETDLRDAKAQVLRACRLLGRRPAHRRPARPLHRRRRRRADGARLRRRAGRGRRPRHRDAGRARGLEVANGRWAGVPFRLRSGKALARSARRSLITFKAPAARARRSAPAPPQPDRLRLLMGPDRMALGLTVNGPDDPLELDHVEMDADLGAGRLPAYGEVLAGVLDGDPLLSVRGDTAEQCWRIVDPVLQAWRAGDVPLDTYPAGSDGPGRLEPERSGRRWSRLVRCARATASATPPDHISPCPGRTWSTPSSASGPERGAGLVGVVGGRRGDDPRPPAPVVGVEGDQGVAGEQRTAGRPGAARTSPSVCPGVCSTSIPPGSGSGPGSSGWSATTPGTRSAPAATMAASTGRPRGWVSGCSSRGRWGR